MTCKARGLMLAHGSEDSVRSQWVPQLSACDETQHGEADPLVSWQGYETEKEEKSKVPQRPHSSSGASFWGLHRLPVLPGVGDQFFSSRPKFTPQSFSCLLSSWFSLNIYMMRRVSTQLRIYKWMHAKNFFCHLKSVALVLNMFQMKPTVKRTWKSLL